MVKLEAISGRDVLVQPSRVLAIEHAAHHGNSVIHLGTGINVVVKGTPDEVHAKVFPEANGDPAKFADMGAAESVLYWAASESNPVESARTLARKALGLET